MASFPSTRFLRRGVSRHPGVRIGALGPVLVWAMLFFALPPLAAQMPELGGEPEGETSPPFTAALSALLSPDPGEWLETLDRLRDDPAEARQVLLFGLEEGPASPNRWRIFHHLGEFGEAEDIPQLIAALETAHTPKERRVLHGAMVALRPNAARPVDLALAVEEFSFIQTRPSKRHDTGRDGNYLLSQQVFEAFHLDDLPLGITRRLIALKGRAYKSRKALTRALEKQLGQRRWKRYEKRVLAPLVPLPPRFVQEGRLRLTVANTFARPILLEAVFDIWYARFDPPPEANLLYVAPGETVRLDTPVRIVGSLQGPPIRLDLRLREVQKPLVPLFQKFKLPRPEF